MKAASILTPALLACFTMLAVSAAAQTPPGTLTTIFNFGAASGSSPGTGVLIGTGGALYGTVQNPNSAVYSLTPSGPGWKYEPLYTFTSAVSPNGLAMDSSGVLYGTTYYGGIMDTGCGTSGCGSVYSLTPPAAPGGAWTEATLYNFTGAGNNKNPAAGVTIGPGPVLYGVTNGAGAGTVFSLTPPAAPGDPWVETTIHTFSGGTDGGNPDGTLAIDSNGVLYGTTIYGGPAKNGTAFSLAPPASPGGGWTKTMLFSFGASGLGGGTAPKGGILLGPGGELYGVTIYGGASDNGGTAYGLAPPASPGGAWTQTVLHSFSRKSNIPPLPGPLSWGANGVLYGATYEGGQGQGSIYALIPPSSGSSWSFLALYSFATPGGILPAAGQLLAVGSSGLIYGTTSQGGKVNDGTVFSLVP